jgi:deoxyadenosine/deoxycytidine kinase
MAALRPEKIGRYPMLIAIEGCLGAGKSTVATGLAECRNSRLVLEAFEANPFLRAFYENPVEHAIETEFAFLLLHFHQLKDRTLADAGLEVIADFHLGKDLIYADLNLKDLLARRLFGQLYELCSERTPAPSLLIFLSAATDMLVQRTRARNRDFELGIDPEYYEAVNSAYENFFERYAGKKLRVSMEHWDFVKEPALYEKLSSLIDGELNIK